MVLKSTWASGEVLTAADFNAVAVDVNTASTTLATVTTAATANSIAKRDANGNLSADNFLFGFVTTVTAAGTTTLTADGPHIQEFTGTLAQTVVLPTTNTPAGTQFYIINNSTGLITVQSSALATISVLAAGRESRFTALTTSPTTAAHWEDTYFGTVVASGKAAVINNSLTLAGTDATTMTFPGTSDTVVTLGATQTLTAKTLTSARVNALLDTNGNTLLGSTPIASAVNYLTVQNNATGGAPAFTSVGTDPNIHLYFNPKGSGGLGIFVATGQTPKIFSDGVDANHNLNLIPKGTGVVQANGSPVVTPAITHAATLKTALASADEFMVLDSEASFALKRTTWQNQVDILAALFSTATMTFTNKRNTPRVVAVTSAATPAINTDSGDHFNLTALATNVTSMTTSLTGTPTDGQKMIIRIKSAAAQTIAWGASFVSSGVAVLPTATVAGKTHTVGFIYDAAVSDWVCVAADSAGY